MRTQPTCARASTRSSTRMRRSSSGRSRSITSPSRCATRGVRSQAAGCVPAGGGGQYDTHEDTQTR
eukprot:3922813-Prymnesium_polylepis.1